MEGYDGSGIAEVEEQEEKVETRYEVVVETSWYDTSVQMARWLPSPGAADSCVIV